MAFQLDKDGALCAVAPLHCVAWERTRRVSRYEINRVTTRWCGQHIPPRLRIIRHTHTGWSLCFVFTLPSCLLLRVPFLGFVSKESAKKEEKRSRVNSFVVCLIA